MFQTLLEGIETYLNDPARGYSQSFTAVREWMPTYKLEQITGLNVKVFAGEEERFITARTGWELRKQVGVHVVDPVTDEASIDADMQLVEEIKDSLCGLRQISGYGLQRIEDSEAFNTEAMLEAKVFVHIMGFTYTSLLDA